MYNDNNEIGRTAAKIAAYILILLAVTGITGAIVHFTDGLKSDFKTFYVTVEGKDIFTSGGGYKASQKGPLKAEVKYALTENKGYSVKIVPNVLDGKDFDFVLDGEVYSFQAEKDLTKGFEIEHGESSFTVTPKGSITDILQAIYPESTVEDCDDKKYENMYTVIVTSYDGKASVRINFTTASDVSGVTFEKEAILF